MLYRVARKWDKGEEGGGKGTLSLVSRRTLRGQRPLRSRLRPDCVRLTFRGPTEPRLRRGRPWPAALLLLSASRSHSRRHPLPMMIRDRSRCSSSRYIDGVALRTDLARGGKNAKRGRKPRGRRRFRRDEACRALRLRGLGWRDRVGADQLFYNACQAGSARLWRENSMTKRRETCDGGRFRRAPTLSLCSECAGLVRKTHP